MEFDGNNCCNNFLCDPPPRTMGDNDNDDRFDEGINARTVTTSKQEAMRNMTFQNLELRRRMILAAFSSSSINMLLPLLGGAGPRLLSTMVVTVALLFDDPVAGGIHRSIVVACCGKTFLRCRQIKESSPRRVSINHVSSPVSHTWWSVIDRSQRFI
jgi:hypothetical protein